MASLKDALFKIGKQDGPFKFKFGFLGSQSKAYKEAQDALDEEAKQEGESVDKEKKENTATGGK